MELKNLADGLSVSEQVLPSDMNAIKDAGFGGIICNRPDGEEAGQPTFDEIATAAKAAGLKVIHQPIIPGQISQSDAEDFANMVSTMSGPVLAFCRTGARSSMLWSMSQNGA
ncbi:MAG: TIGR01244 family sulfur transferase [Paracoccaceae bacterium]|nr:TIGR01244 family sulfur transferase [Paracoccaceae bacterium]